MNWTSRGTRAFVFNSVLMFLLPIFHVVTFMLCNESFLWNKGYWILPLFEGLLVMVIYAILKSVEQIKVERKATIDLLYIVVWSILATIYNGVGTIMILFALIIFAL
jgi:hypothetical protein